MNCPHCDSKNTYGRQSKTDLSAIALPVIVVVNR